MKTDAPYMLSILALGVGTLWKKLTAWHSRERNPLPHHWIALCLCTHPRRNFFYFVIKQNVPSTLRTHTCKADSGNVIILVCCCWIDIKVSPNRRELGEHVCFFRGKLFKLLVFTLSWPILCERCHLEPMKCEKRTKRITSAGISISRLFKGSLCIMAGKGNPLVSSFKFLRQPFGRVSVFSASHLSRRRQL